MWYWIKLYCIVRCPIAIVTTVLDALNKRHRYVDVLLPYQRPKKGRVKGAFDKADVGVQWTVDNGHWDCGMWGCGAMYCMFYFWFRRVYNGQLLRKAGSWLAIAYLFNTISFGPRWCHDTFALLQSDIYDSVELQTHWRLSAQLSSIIVRCYFRIGYYRRSCDISWQYTSLAGGKIPAACLPWIIWSHLAALLVKCSS